MKISLPHEHGDFLERKKSARSAKRGNHDSLSRSSYRFHKRCPHALIDDQGVSNGSRSSHGRSVYEQNVLVPGNWDGKARANRLLSVKPLQNNRSHSLGKLRSKLIGYRQVVISVHQAICVRRRYDGIDFRLLIDKRSEITAMHRNAFIAPKSILPGFRHTGAIRHKIQHHVLHTNPFNTRTPMYRCVSRSMFDARFISDPLMGLQTTTSGGC